MIYSPRAPIALRAIALVVALSVAATGSGVPMCLSLVAQATAPCEMHSSHDRTPTPAPTAQSSWLVAQHPQHACHPDAPGLGCAAGGASPTAGPAAAAWNHIQVILRAASRVTVLEPVSTVLSYLAPPPSPPPQA